MPNNCTYMGGGIPLSSEFFKVIKNDLWLFLLPAGFAILLLALFMEEIGFFLRHVPSPQRRRLSLWILGIYPVFGMTSIVSLYVPRSSSLCSFIASLYHSITLLKFMGLIQDFFGGKAKMLEALAGEQVSPNPFPCCCCCCLPLFNINKNSVRWMMAAVLQLSVVRTLLFFLALVLWTDEQYDYGDVNSANPNLYINAIIAVSTFLSFYGYLLFYKATKKALPGYGIRAKFICIIIILVLCGLQSGILETMGALRVIPCTPPFSDIFRSQLIYHYAIIVEMFCISLFAHQTFRKVEPCHEEGDEMVVRVLSEKAIQTEEELSCAVQLSGQEDEPCHSNIGYNSDSEEDSLCKIEHAPLGHFPFSFPLQHTQQTAANTDKVYTKPPEDSTRVELPTNTVRAEIHHIANADATVV
nr:organic solute transporter subunit alpha [Misgurnus anguillicaudatus]